MLHRSPAQGEVDRGEFRNAINALGFGALASRQDIDLLFNEFDVSGDGVISFEELNKMLRQSRAVDAKMLGGIAGEVALKAEEGAMLKRQKRTGIDGNIKLEEARLAADVLQQLRGLFAGSPRMVMELFRDIDTSGDGLVSRSEFSLAMRALGLSLPKRELRLLFEELDPDGSNAIDFRELRDTLCTVATPQGDCTVPSGRLELTASVEVQIGTVVWS